MSDVWLPVTRSAVNSYIDMTILTFASFPGRRSFGSSPKERAREAYRNRFI